MADLNQGASIEAELTEFEEWAREYGLDLDYCEGPSGHSYLHPEATYALDAWLAARRTPPIAAAGEEGLPPLPEPAGQMNKKTTRELEWPFQPGYTAEQYQQGQRDAIALYQRKQADLQAHFLAAQDQCEHYRNACKDLRAQLAHQSQGEPRAWLWYEPASEWNGYQGRERVGLEKPKASAAVNGCHRLYLAAPTASQEGDQPTRGKSA